jgi:predicted MPP superfamily phosphohydrolase
MLRLLHLSDIHFHPSPGDPQRDVDLAVRQDLLADLRALDNAVRPIGAVLVAGDLAARGKDDEFELARAFLTEVCEIVDCPPHHIACVPGNHDIDRDAHGPLHEGLRRLLRTQPSARIADQLETIFTDEPASAVLHAPLAAYNRFAKPLGFAVTAEEPVPAGWDLALGEHTVRLRGVNSALVCDASDAHEHDGSRVVLGANQLSVLSRDHDLITVLMCHHPGRWLRDADHVDAWLARPHLLLTGHEHELGIVPRPDGLSLSIASGAVNPERAQPGWAPAYNVLELDVQDGHLLVRVRVRTYGTGRTGFGAHPDRPEPEVFRIPLSRAAAPAEPAVSSAISPPAPVQSDEREMIFDILSVAPDIREASARHIGLLADDEALRTQEDEDGLIVQARERGALEALAKAVARA